MSKVILTALFILNSLFSLAQKGTKVIYKDSLDHAITYEGFRKATELGTLFSRESVINGDTMVHTYKLEPKLELKKSSDERPTLEKKTLGTTLPDIPLKRLDGSDFSLSVLKGKILVINFWSIQCVQCIAEMPELNEIVSRYKNYPEVLFFAPALNDVDELKKFLGKQRFSYIVLGNSNDLCKRIDISSFPTSVIIDSNGLIAEVIARGKETIGSTIAEALDKMLPKTKPR